MTPRPGKPHITPCKQVWKILFVKRGRVRYVIANTFKNALVMALYYRGDPPGREDYRIRYSGDVNWLRP